jgi:hypothetical protein
MVELFSMKVDADKEFGYDTVGQAWSILDTDLDLTAVVRTESGEYVYGLSSLLFFQSLLGLCELKDLGTACSIEEQAVVLEFPRIPEIDTVSGTVVYHDLYKH